VVKMGLMEEPHDLISRLRIIARPIEGLLITNGRNLNFENNLFCLPESISSTATHDLFQLQERILFFQMVLDFVMCYAPA